MPYGASAHIPTILRTVCSTSIDNPENFKKLLEALEAKFSDPVNNLFQFIITLDLGIFLKERVDK